MQLFCNRGFVIHYSKKRTHAVPAGRNEWT
nr:MAG TPA: bacterial toxin [Caudoviricetes sp.]